MEIGQKIAAFRIKSNRTQEQLAAELFVSRELVSKWETGKSVPDYRTVVRMSAIFSVPVEALFDKERRLTEELSACVPAGCRLTPEELRDALDAFLSTLPRRDRAVFIRRYYFFEEAAEIGSEYGLKEGSVRTVLLRTRRKLKQYLKGGAV